MAGRGNVLSLHDLSPNGEEYTNLFLETWRRSHIILQDNIETDFNVTVLIMMWTRFISLIK
jgi:hypothetical protein